MEVMWNNTMGNNARQTQNWNEKKKIRLQMGSMDTSLGSSVENILGIQIQ